MIKIGRWQRGREGGKEAGRERETCGEAGRWELQQVQLARYNAQTDGVAGGSCFALDRPTWNATRVGAELLPALPRASQSAGATVVPQRTVFERPGDTRRRFKTGVVILENGLLN